jgi:predicted ATPase
VFAGGFTLAAAEAVSGGPLTAAPLTAGAPPPAGDVLAHVTALVEKSLLTAEPQGETTRYRMLETIRQYAREQLAGAGEEHATRDRHLTWAAGLYEAAEAGLTGPARRRGRQRARPSWTTPGPRWPGPCVPGGPGTECGSRR